MPSMGRSENRTILRQTSNSSAGTSTASPKGRLNFFKKWPSSSGSSGPPQREDSGSSDRIAEVCARGMDWAFYADSAIRQAITLTRCLHLRSYCQSWNHHGRISPPPTRSVAHPHKTRSFHDFTITYAAFGGHQAGQTPGGWTRHGMFTRGQEKILYIFVRI